MPYRFHVIGLLSILMIWGGAVYAQEGNARKTEHQVLTPAQQQFAKQIGQRLERNPSYRSVDAEWRRFVQNQPSGTDFNAIINFIQHEAMSNKVREVNLVREKYNVSSQKKSSLAHELEQAKRQRAQPNQRAKISDLERRYKEASDDTQLKNIEMQNILQKQQQAINTMSQVSKQLHDTAMAIIRKIGG